MGVLTQKGISQRPNETMKVLSSIVVFLAIVAAALAYTTQWGARKTPTDFCTAKVSSMPPDQDNLSSVMFISQKP